MHVACAGFPECTSDDPDNGDLIHTTPVKTAHANGHSASPDMAASATVVSAKHPHSSPEQSRSSLSPNQPSKKRCRSVLGDQLPNVKVAVPKRKISKNSARDSSSVTAAKENEDVVT